MTNTKFKNKKNSPAYAFRGGWCSTEIDKITLKNGTIIRARKAADDQPVILEFFAHGWRIVDAESAANLSVAFGIKAKTFILRHNPQLFQEDK